MMMEKIKSHLRAGESGQLPASSAVQGLLKLLRFNPDFYAVFESWDKEANSVVKGCEAVAIQGSRLVVKVPSVAHRQELLYSKERILARVHQAMGRRVITDVQFELANGRGGDIREQSKNRFEFKRN